MEGERQKALGWRWLPQGLLWVPHLPACTTEDITSMNSNFLYKVLGQSINPWFQIPPR
jgi:hypothetical protein